jgi:hypothetical protein
MSYIVITDPLFASFYTFQTLNVDKIFICFYLFLCTLVSVTYINIGSLKKEVIFTSHFSICKFLLQNVYGCLKYLVVKSFLMKSVLNFICSLHYYFYRIPGMHSLSAGFSWSPAQMIE